MDELSISERLEHSVHLFALGNPSRSLAAKDRSLKVIAVGVVVAGGAVFSCAHILYICRMSYFLALERFAVFVAAQMADAEYLLLNPNQH